MSLKCTKVKQDCGLFYTDDNLDCLPLTPMQGDTNLTYTNGQTDGRKDGQTSQQSSLTCPSCLDRSDFSIFAHPASLKVHCKFSFEIAMNVKEKD